MRLEDLRTIPLFDGLTDDQLADLASGSDEVAVDPGGELFREGELADSWWVLVDGAVELARRSGREDTVVGVMDVPGRWAGGFRAWDPHGVYLATGRGARPGRMLRVPAELLRARLEAWFPLGGPPDRRPLQHRPVDRVHRASARLAGHPRHAGRRARPRAQQPGRCREPLVDALEATCDTLLSSLAGLAEGHLHARHFTALDDLRRRLVDSEANTDASADPLAAAAAEEELAGWLRRHGLGEPSLLAGQLANVGADLAWCEEVSELVPDATLVPALTWVASTQTATRLLGEVREATGRVSHLVTAVRSYTQLDRASLQPVEVTDGLDSTLVILGHKVRDATVTVVRDYDDDLPRIEGFAGELNQVWTNLLDNAVDAMPTGARSQSASTRSATRSRWWWATPVPGCPPRSPPARSTRSTPPRRSGRAPDSASTSPGAWSWNATAVRSPSTRPPPVPPSGYGCR